MVFVRRDGQQSSWTARFPFLVNYWQRRWRERGPCNRQMMVWLALFFLLVASLMVFRDFPWDGDELSERYTKLKFVSSSSSSSSTTTTTKQMGAIVFLAPQRNEGSIWEIDRFCMLLRAVRSVDQHLNTKFGPYPIYILFAKDFEQDPRRKDGAYSEADQALFRRWAPHSSIHFVPIEMYSGEALEPDTTREQILEWREGKDGAVAGRDLGYTSMCRLWSGRLQSMSFLDGFTYYLRMDDDSLLTEDLPFDPFTKMEQEGLIYAYRRISFDRWGIDKLWNVTRPHLLGGTEKEDLPFVDAKGVYDGFQPYNNFHVTLVAFWRSNSWQGLWRDFNRNNLFFKHRVGDANVHAIAIMMMGRDKVSTWSDFPYVHNSNDYGPDWWKEAKSWREECRRDYAEFLNKKQ